MGWARLGLVSCAVAAAGACTSDSADPATAMRDSEIWTAVDDDYPLLESRETEMGQPEPGDCELMLEVHELPGPDERALTEIQDVALQEGWDLDSRGPIAGSAVGSIDGPAPQLIIVRPMGETTLHVAYTVQMDPQFDLRWTLTSIGTCRDTNPDVPEPPQG